MEKPSLIVMAAGLGSRYGGMKQIDPVDENGCSIIDYSVFDAMRAGFEKIVLVIKKEHERDFVDTIVARTGGKVKIEFAYQDIQDVPEGIEVPLGRVKPWGTAHAVLSARGLVKGPIAAINADDFYGRKAFEQVYDYLVCGHGENAHAMVGFRLKNTMTDFGSVSRGVCKVDAYGHLYEIIERVRIEYNDGGIGYTEDGGASYIELEPDTLVSMNMWGFGSAMMGEIEARFKPFLEEKLRENPLKCEYFLPYVPDCLINEGVGTVAVLPTEDRWYGVTYKDDMPTVRAAIADMKAQGKYPAELWK